VQSTHKQANHSSVQHPRRSIQQLQQVLLLQVSFIHTYGLTAVNVQGSTSTAAACYSSGHAAFMHAIT